MSYGVVFTPGAQRDLDSLFEVLVQHDLATARKAISAIKRGLGLLELFPLSCRRSAGTSDPRWRELVVPFGRAGFVLLFEVLDPETVRILAVRHQREDDFWL